MSTNTPEELYRATRLFAQNVEKAIKVQLFTLQRSHANDTVFTCFPRLPSELRKRIWRQAGLTGRVVDFAKYAFDFDRKSKSLFTLTHPISNLALLRVNKESRTETLRNCVTLNKPVTRTRTNLSRILSRSSPLHFNTNVDIVLLSDSFLFPVIHWLRSLPMILANIKNLELSDVTFRRVIFEHRFFDLEVTSGKTYEYNKNSVYFLLSFKNLTVFTLTEQGQYFRTEPDCSPIWWEQRIGDFFRRNKKYFRAIPTVRVRRCNWMLSWETLVKLELLDGFSIGWRRFWKTREVVPARTYDSEDE